MDKELSNFKRVQIPIQIKKSRIPHLGQVSAPSSWLWLNSSPAQPLLLPGAAESCKTLKGQRIILNEDINTCTTGNMIIWGWHVWPDLISWNAQRENGPWVKFQVLLFFGEENTINTEQHLDFCMTQTFLGSKHSCGWMCTGIFCALSLSSCLILLNFSCIVYWNVLLSLKHT